MFICGFWCIYILHINKSLTFCIVNIDFLDVEILLDLVARFGLFSTNKHIVKYLSRVGA